MAKRNLKKASDVGVRIAMGTDSGPSPERFIGYFEHLEMEMMADAGMTPLAVLRAATVDAARAMRAEDVGALVPGAWADLMALDRDPREDIRHTRAISSVWVHEDLQKPTWRTGVLSVRIAARVKAPASAAD